ncbi:MAG: response regulator [Treponema sp.]|nr:response regulator [Treponema sp.]
MYRVLIVDDEEPVLDSFSFMLKEYATDFVLAGKARNGYEALNTIHELHPDVVFMDINIPGMDGLKVIDSVHEQYPQMVFVLSTAYERFDLAQRAIPLGVHAYLVKPISKKVFISTLEDIKAKLMKNRPLGLLEKKNAILAQFFNDVTHRGLYKDQIELYAETLGIGSRYGCICIVEIEEHNEKTLVEIASRISLKYFCLFSARNNRGFYFVGGQHESNELKTHLSGIMTQCVSPETETVIGVGGTETLENLAASYTSALHDLLKNKTDEQVLYRERVRIVQIRKKIGYVPKDELTNLFMSYLDELFEYYELPVVKCKMAVLFNLLLDDLVNYYKDTEPVPHCEPVEQELMNNSSAEDIKRWGLDYFENLLDMFSEKRNSAMPLPLLKAINYIKDHYAEPIQLSTVADAVLVSPAYLSRIFTEYLSTPFVDYVTDLRISEAQRLIKTTNMNIKEIGIAVGYGDANYFSKCFKKYTGYTPTDYLETARNT